MIKAAILGLVRGYPNIYGYSKLIRRNRLLHKNFNRYHNYPVIIFHEGNIQLEHQKVIAKITPNISFVDISSKAFVRPPNLPADDEDGISYKHMCRFYALQIYDFVHNFDYFLRLDDDSFLESPIRYDLFSFMSKHELVYGYIYAENEYHEQTVATLPAFTRSYISRNAIKTQCLLEEINELYYYSNFTITRVDFWRRSEVQDYLRAVDDSLGIYQYRWGDHILQTLALKMFCEPPKIHCFQDFKYSHGSHGWSNYPHKVVNPTYRSLWKRVAKRLERMYLDYQLKTLA